MTSAELYGALWDLRTSPLSPTADADGQPLDPSLVQGTLDPSRDARLVRYYFDHYEWSGSRHFVHLSKDHAFEEFNPSADALLVMIAGGANHGRRSLANLMLYKIGQQAGESPLVIDVELQGRNQPENVKACAQLFIFAYTRDPGARPTRADLLAIFEQQTKGKPTGDRACYATLFQILRQEIRPHFMRPIVLRVSGGDHYDTWETIYNSTRTLFSYIIVATSFESHVGACRKSLGERAAVVRAGGLDRAMTARFLEERIGHERRAPASTPSLAPFSEEALDELFKAGAVGQPVRLDIGYVKRVLRRALDTHVEHLAAYATTHGADALRQRPSRELLIDAGRIRDSGREVNRGRA
jgi:hypothetical protein